MSEELIIKKFQESEQEEFNEVSFWEKVKNVAKKAGLKVIYVALLLYYVMRAKSTSIADKALIGGALAYFVSPIDILPDFLPGVGFADDLVVLLFVLGLIKRNITDEIKSQAEIKLGEWFYTDDKELSDVSEEINV